MSAFALCPREPALRRRRSCPVAPGVELEQDARHPRVAKARLGERGSSSDRRPTSSLLRRAMHPPHPPSTWSDHPTSWADDAVVAHANVSIQLGEALRIMDARVFLRDRSAGGSWTTCRGTVVDARFGRHAETLIEPDARRQPTRRGSSRVGSRRGCGWRWPTTGYAHGAAGRRKIRPPCGASLGGRERRRSRCWARAGCRHDGAPRTRTRAGHRARPRRSCLNGSDKGAMM